MTDPQKPLELGPLAIEHTYVFEAFDKDGRLKWREEVKNLVVTEGRNDVLDKYYKGSAYSAAHYLGLKGAGKARALAEVTAAVCLAGELSIIGALCAHEFASAHKNLARGKA